MTYIRHKKNWIDSKFSHFYDSYLRAVHRSNRYKAAVYGRNEGNTPSLLKVPCDKRYQRTESEQLTFNCDGQMWESGKKKAGETNKKESNTGGGNLSRWHFTEQHSCLNISAAPCLSVPRLKKGEQRKKEKKWQVRPEASTYHCSPPAKSPGGRGEAADSSSRLLFFGPQVSSTPTKSAVSLLLLPLGPHLPLLFTYMTSAVGGVPGEHTLRPIYVPKFKAQARVERERERVLV